MANNIASKNVLKRLTSVQAHNELYEVKNLIDVSVFDESNNIIWNNELRI